MPQAPADRQDIRASGNQCGAQFLDLLTMFRGMEAMWEKSIHPAPAYRRSFSSMNAMLSRSAMRDEDLVKLPFDGTYSPAARSKPVTSG